MLSYIGNAKSGLAFLKEQRQDYEEALALAREANEVCQRVGLAVGLEQTRELIERLEKKIAEGRSEYNRTGSKGPEGQVTEEEH